MKRYIQYIIIALLASFTAVSCLEELEPETPVFENEVLTLVPRVQSFANQYVTKAGEGDAEIKSLAVLIFNNGGSLVHKQEFTDFENASVNINKTMLNLNNPTKEQKLTEATVVMIANIPLANIKNSDEESLADVTSLTLEGLNAYTYTLTDAQAIITEKPTTGFPMVGNATVNLSHTYTEAIGVELNILYAKINFSISVTSGSENQGDGVSFTLEKYTVNNVAKEITLMKPEAETATSSYYSGFTNEPKNTTDLSSNKDPLKFTFYMLESRYEHNLSSTQISSIYPWGTSAGYESYQQMYKPKLVTASGKGIASNVILSGQYTDYRGTKWDVKYTVYLGKDNAQNFQVDRNSEYTNIITIKGIRNNDDYGAGQVWLDHRVDVEYSGSDADDLVKITRETLIDSHIEVRPFRVNLPEGERVWLYLPKYNGSQIEEKDDNINQNWIGVENNDGRMQDFTKYCSNGKRKYFTTSLIEELYLDNTDEKYGVKINLDKDNKRYGQKYIQLFDNDCAWIYIDENVTEQKREAVIELVFYDENLNEIAVESFNIIQGGLEKVADKYYIESYEEYLHTYDSQDLYTDPTKDYTQQGYKWGLDGKTLSKTQTVTSINIASDDYKYDYFHATDLANSSAFFDRPYSIIGGNASENVGLNFTNWIGISDEIPIIDMGTRPESAIQYCLSKNKFKVDESDKEKHTMDIHWYLPDAYEMSEILEKGKNEFTDFSKFAYWTSQPSWNTTLTAYIYEDEQNARAVSLDEKSATEGVYPGTNTNRKEHRRIRCAYSHNGIDDVDFSGNRAPEGIGAARFYMHAWKDWDSREAGYFSWLPQDNTANDETPYTLRDKYDYPKDAGDANQYFGNYIEGYGFEKDPSDQDNWVKEKVSVYTSEVVLGRWPGLTTSNVVERTTTGLTGNQKYYQLDGTKKETESTTTTYFTEYKGDITTSEMKPLDYLRNGTDLSISFAKADGNNLPSYVYYKRNGVKSSERTRTWIVPTYKGNNKTESVNYGPVTTPEGLVKLTASEESTRAQRSGTVLTNSDGYIYTDKQSAIDAGVSAAPIGAYNIVSEAEAPTNWLGREEKVRVYSYKESTFLGSYTRYYEAVRYRYKLTYTLAGQTVTYYSCESDGRWDYQPTQTTGSSNNYANERPTDDQLTMYGGNSFTIKANNGNRISSVKIYYSGSNVVSSSEYLRFTKDGWTGNSAPPGMTYSGNGDTGSMTWNGEPTSEITFKLVRYKENYSLLDVFHLFDPISLEYLSNSNASKSASIVIDQIDVRYMK